MADTMLQPGMQIRPQMTEAHARELVERLYGLKVTKIKELISYDDRNYHVKVSSEHSNPHIREIWPHGFVLKVLNSMDSQKKHVEAEHEAQAILKAQGYNVPCPVLNLQGRDTQLERIYRTPEEADQWNQNNESEAEQCHPEHMVRLLTFLPGTIFVQVPYRPDLLFQVGSFIGGLQKALTEFSHPALTSHQTIWCLASLPNVEKFMYAVKDEGYQEVIKKVKKAFKEEEFSHPALTSHLTIWSLASVPNVEKFLYAVKDEGNQDLVKKVIKAFREEVLPKSEHFQKGVIHGDYNEQNIIVRPRQGYEDKPDDEKLYDVHGLIDFGDMQETCYVYELAITIMYMMVGSKVVDPFQVGGHVTAGYLTQRSLSEVEFDALKVCVAGRYVQSLVMGAYSYLQDPGNEYVLVTAANGWPQLKQLWETPKEELYAGWREIIDSYKS